MKKGEKCILFEFRSKALWTSSKVIYLEAAIDYKEWKPKIIMNNFIIFITKISIQRQVRMIISTAKPLLKVLHHLKTMIRYIKVTVLILKVNLKKRNNKKIRRKRTKKRKGKPYKGLTHSKIS